MNADYWFPWYPVVFRCRTLEKAPDMTAEQECYYRRLIDYYMETRSPLPDSDVGLCKIAGAVLDSNTIGILRLFFKPSNGKLHHSFCDEILDNQDSRSSKRSEVAKANIAKRWKSKPENKQKNTNGITDELPKNTTGQDRTIDSNKLESHVVALKTKAVIYSPEFENFWQAYPNRTGKAAALKAYQSATKSHGVDHATLLERCQQFSAAHMGARTPTNFIPHPATWLNRAGWLDDFAAITARGESSRPVRSGQNSISDAIAYAMGDQTRRDPGHCAGSDQSPEYMPDPRDV